MSGKNINFEGKKTKKSYLYKNKKVLKVDETDINKILVSKKEPYRANKSIKYFIGYNDDDVIGPLCIKLLQLIGYGYALKIKISFKVTDNKLLKRYIKMWKNISSSVGKKFDSESVLVIMINT